jgi:flagellar biosynthesis/type III secretory pathway protein FliH
MTKEEIMKWLDDALDEVYNDGWDEGYRRGLEDQDA